MAIKLHQTQPEPEASEASEPLADLELSERWTDRASKWINSIPFGLLVVLGLLFLAQMQLVTIRQLQAVTVSNQTMLQQVLQKTANPRPAAFDTSKLSPAIYERAEVRNAAGDWVSDLSVIR